MQNGEARWRDSEPAETLTSSLMIDLRSCSWQAEPVLLVLCLSFDDHSKTEEEMLVADPNRGRQARLQPVKRLM